MLHAWEKIKKKVLVAKPELSRPLGRPASRLEDSIETGLTEIGLQ
jgi:hypothetical protein